MSVGVQKGDHPPPAHRARAEAGVSRAFEYRTREGEMRRLAEASALGQRRGLYLIAADRYALLARLEEAVLARAAPEEPDPQSTG